MLFLKREAENLVMLVENLLDNHKVSLNGTNAQSFLNTLHITFKFGTIKEEPGELWCSGLNIFTILPIKYVKV